ncbi:cysteine desulfarase [Pontibacillus halophilus JSM 076056 = DSM 19796]|uniref:Cysteine desulfarase n=1 Tax=Pontibacillus halophilus JSM 076056 = DSM 19796 TaxID=1385510 RepID=A0A0A5GKG5_9BACI|nr:IscS subfamily cysteine desulfurase [Pontibacillus halophilus]KGX93776.1 cysteine desulfarase [Pontibacillus halophilus JSM 076056 = DSM 19796]
MIYLDYASTCPLDEEALQVYGEVSRQYFGNTESLHDRGTESAQLLEVCRATLARQLSVPSSDLFFTSGGTESNALGIRALASATNRKKIITTMAEHESVHCVVGRLQREGMEVVYVPMDLDGRINVNQLYEYLDFDVAMVILQHVNGEIGSIQPIQEVRRMCDEYGVFLHVDCVQSLGKQALGPILEGVHSAAFSAHKVYGPKGVGALLLRSNVAYEKRGSGHESGVRAGTVDLPGIAAFITAAERLNDRIGQNGEKDWKLREALLSELSDQVVVYGSCHVRHQQHAIIGLSIPGIEGQYAMLECNRHGIAISTGSACSIGKEGNARIMQAMGVEDHVARTFIRVSFGQETQLEDVRSFMNVVEKLQAERAFL